MCSAPRLDTITQRSEVQKLTLNKYKAERRQDSINSQQRASAQDLHLWYDMCESREIGLSSLMET